MTTRLASTAPTKTNAITDAKIFPESEVRETGGPWPIASMLSK